MNQPVNPFWRGLWRLADPKISLASFAGIFLAVCFAARDTGLHVGWLLATWLGVLLSVSLSTVVTLALMCTQEWYVVWYWPIGFSIALVLGYLASLLQSPQPTEFTYFQVIRNHKRT